MLTNKVFSTLLVVVSMTSVSLAQLVPGPGRGGSGGNQNQPNPPRYQDGCNNSYGPCEPGRPSRPDYPNNPERPDRPGHGHDRPDYGRPDHGYPGHGRPDRPNPPRYPDYPNYPQPQPYPQPYPQPQPDYPNYGQQEVRSGYIGRSVRNERISLAQLVGLSSYYQGWEIVSVRAVARPNSSSTTIARLVVDGRIVASQTNPGYEIGLYPQVRLVIGNVQGLQLEIVGSTQIENVDVILQNNGGGYYPQPPVGSDNQIDIPLHRNTYGDDQIDLNPYVDFYRYNGYRIEQIVVQANATRGSALVDFLINGFHMGTIQFNGGYTSRGSLYISQRPVIGRDASSLVLYTRGNLTIDQVTLVLSRY